MSEREAIAYIEQWDVTEAAKVLKWYEDNELLRPCDCDTMIAIETESLRDENAKLRELVRDAWGSGHPDKSCGDCEIRDECHDDMERLSRDGVLRFSRCLFELRIEDRMRELGIEVN